MSIFMQMFIGNEYLARIRKRDVEWENFDWLGDNTCPTFLHDRASPITRHPQENKFNWDSLSNAILPACDNGVDQHARHMPKHNTSPDVSHLPANSPVTWIKTV
ncbi:hypothetical protein WN944_011942 [Citrus x changshan-huyou]|uniref:Uncharacterized protein n=1 Tax=Citrus x changshan-huyou TaxID=2935761 RepID=A0AAP0QYK0_9ROSI